MKQAAEVIYTTATAATNLQATPWMKVKDLPACTYSLEELEPTRSKGVIHHRNYLGVVRVIDTDYDTCLDLAGQARTAFEAIQGTTVAGHAVRFCRVTSGSDLQDDDFDGFVKDITINITIQE